MKTYKQKEFSIRLTLLLCASLLVIPTAKGTDDMFFNSKDSYFSFGPCVHLPQSDYVDGGAGFNLLFGGNVAGRHDVMLNFDCNFGLKCQKDMYGNNGVIRQGDRVVSISLNTFYGVRARQLPSCNLTPIAGIGVRSYNGGERYEECREEDDPAWMEKVGFSMNLGLLMDFHPFIQCRSNDQSIRFMPYFSLSKYVHDVGLVPSANLSLLWTFNFRH